MEKQNVEEFIKQLETTDLISLFNIDQNIDPETFTLSEFLGFITEDIEIMQDIEINEISNFSQFKKACIELIKNKVIDFLKQCLTDEEAYIDKKFKRLENNKKPLEKINNILSEYDSEMKSRFNELGLGKYDLSGIFDKAKLIKLLEYYNIIIAKNEELKEEKNDEDLKDKRNKVMLKKDSIIELKKGAEGFLQHIKDSSNSTSAEWFLKFIEGEGPIPNTNKADNIQPSQKAAKEKLDEIEKIMNESDRYKNDQIIKKYYTESKDKYSGSQE